MTEDRRGRVSYVIGHDGSPLILADLPGPDTKRWTISRKADVVAAVNGGLLSLDDACKRYALTVEEFLSWRRSIDRFGLAGLRATRVQQYRDYGFSAAGNVMTAQNNQAPEPVAPAAVHAPKKPPGPQNE